MAKRTQAPQQRQHELLHELAALDFCLPGSLSTRQMRCGKPGCRCKADPPQLHGPYTYWTRTVGGRTVAQLLSTEQLKRYRPGSRTTAAYTGSSKSSKRSRSRPPNAPKAGSASDGPKHPHGAAARPAAL